MKKILVVGYGSIGKRHVNNLLSLGINSYIYDVNINKPGIINSLKNIPDIQYCIISTPTAYHYQNFIDIISTTKCKNILIEKPIDINLNNAIKILDIASKNNIYVHVAYNLRYLNCFKKIKEVIKKNKNDIRIVKISSGQYLPDWRKNIDYRDNYSAHKNQGGGVDLDLSHEIDYMLWLFGEPVKRIASVRKKISSLEIDSIDYYKGLFDYGNLIIDLELDYIRKRERKLVIIGENKEILNVDFINKIFTINGIEIQEENLFDFDRSYSMELEEFIGLADTKKLCTLKESIKVLKLLKEY